MKILELFQFRLGSHIFCLIFNAKANKIDLKESTAKYQTLSSLLFPEVELRLRSVTSESFNWRHYDSN